MELQWNQSNCAYLRCSLWETQNVEQTLEVRLTDGMPDIGRVICVWGQPVLRSKEWRGDNVMAGGGVTAWVLYTPEDGSAPRCMESWIPFQAKWNLSDSRREGVLRFHCCLRSADARALSSRKMMVRISVGIFAEALELTDCAVYSPTELPDEIQLLENSYPAVLPKEAGEKLIAIDEEMNMPGEMPKSILCCQIYPGVMEQNVIGGRAVFKGNCRVRLLCLMENGDIRQQEHTLPFAQYADLDRDYDKDAAVSVMLAVSNVEPELGANGIRLHCGLVAQYMIFAREMLSVAEDAYCLHQKITPQVQMLQLPMLLDQGTEIMDAAVEMPVEAERVVDVSFFPDQPCQFRENGEVLAQIGGNFQVLYYDPDGNLQLATEPWSDEWRIPMGEQGAAFVNLVASEPTQEGRAEVKLEMRSVSQRPIPMIAGLQIAEKTEPDPNRPSLILRRAGNETLWELAKTWGSTVETIRKANELAGEPENGQMLLIPIA